MLIRTLLTECAELVLTPYIYSSVYRCVAAGYSQRPQGENGATMRAPGLIPHTPSLWGIAGKTRPIFRNLAPVSLKLASPRDFCATCGRGYGRKDKKRKRDDADSLHTTLTFASISSHSSATRRAAPPPLTGLTISTALLSQRRPPRTSRRNCRRKPSSGRSVGAAPTPRSCEGADARASEPTVGRRRAWHV